MWPAIGIRNLNMKAAHAGLFHAPSGAAMMAAMKISASTWSALATICGVWVTIWPRFSLPIAVASAIVLAILVWVDTFGRPRPRA
jgi:hypothetical protein